MDDVRTTALPKHASEALKAIRACSYADGVGRMRAMALLSALDGEQRELVPKQPAESVKHAAERPGFAANVLKPAYDGLTYLYDSPPTRTSTTEQRWSDVLYTRRSGIDVYMDRADFLARTGGLSVVRPVIMDADSADPWARLSVSSRAQVFAAWNVEDPEVADAILIRLTPIPKVKVSVDPRTGAKTHSTQSAYGSRRITWELWTRQMRVRFVMSCSGRAAPDVGTDVEIIRSDVHGLGYVPLVICRNQAVTDSFWVAPNGGYDVLANAMDVSRHIQRLIFLANSSHGQKVLSLEDIKNAPQYTGQDAPWILGLLDKATTLDGGADLAGIMASAELALDLLAISLGLPSGSLRLSAIGSTSNSAALIEVIGSRAQGDRTQRRGLFSGSERDLHRIVADYIPDLDPDVTTSFTEADRPLDPSQLDSRITMMIDKGLITRSEALRKYEHGITTSTADRRIAAATLDRELAAAVEIAIARDPSRLAADTPGSPDGTGGTGGSVDGDSPGQGDGDSSGGASDGDSPDTSGG